MWKSILVAAILTILPLMSHAEVKLEDFTADSFSQQYAIATGAATHETGVAFYNDLIWLNAEYGDTFAGDAFFAMVPLNREYTLKAYEAALSGERKETSAWLADSLVYLNWEIEVLALYTSTGELASGVVLEDITSTHPTITISSIIENFPGVTQIFTPEIQSKIRALEADIIPSLERRLAAEKAETAAEKAETAAEKAETAAEKAETAKLDKLEATLLSLYPKN